METWFCQKKKKSGKTAHWTKKTEFSTSDTGQIGWHKAIDLQYYWRECSDSLKNDY